MSGQRKLLIFVVKVFVLILIFSSFWPFVAPGYASVLAAASNAVAPANIKIMSAGGLIIVNYGAQLEQAGLRTLPFQAGLLLLLSLIIATPGLKVGRRVLYIGIGALLTFALHIASVLVWCTNVSTMRPFWVLFVVVGIDLFPVLIWAAVSAKYWWPRRGAVPSLRAETRQ